MMSTQPRKPAGSPNATGGQYDFKTGMDQPPRLPAAYFDGSMDDDERAMWAEGIDAAREGWADNHQEFDKDGNMTLVDGCRARVRLSMLGNTFVEIRDTPHSYPRWQGKIERGTELEGVLSPEANRQVMAAVSQWRQTHDYRDFTSTLQNVEPDAFIGMNGTNPNARDDADLYRQVTDKFTRHRVFVYQGRKLKRAEARTIARDAFVNAFANQRDCPVELRERNTDEARAWFDEQYPN